ncbi:hypothetical protein [Streptomyces griseoruber]|nr:hypothetical protein [Streptomyces griseoruber]
MRDGPACYAEIDEVAALTAAALAQGFVGRPARRRSVHSPVTTL